MLNYSLPIWPRNHLIVSSDKVFLATQKNILALVQVPINVHIIVVPHQFYVCVFRNFTHENTYSIVCGH